MLQRLFSSHLGDVEQLRIHDVLGRLAARVARGTGGVGNRVIERTAERSGLKLLAARDGIGSARPRICVAEVTPLVVYRGRRGKEERWKRGDGSVGQWRRRLRRGRQQHARASAKGRGEQE